MRLMQILSESYYDSLTLNINEVGRRNIKAFVEVFKNPSAKEIDEVFQAQKAVRGIVFPSGDFYIVTSKTDLLHADIVRVLSKLGLMKAARNPYSSSNMKEFLAVEKQYGGYVLSPGYESTIGDAQRYSDLIEQYNKKFTKKNKLEIISAIGGAN